MSGGTYATLVLMQHPFDNLPTDPVLFGWNATPGIVSVHADREGRAIVWRRVGGATVTERVRFRPWLLAVTLDDLVAGGAHPVREGEQGSERAPFCYRELTGPPGSFRFQILAGSGRALEKMICAGAARRFGRAVAGLYDLDGYYRVGPVEQYLMQTGQVYFRDMVYADLCRMQIDFETTALEPEHGRIFMAAVRDTNGLAEILDAPQPEDESQLIRDLLALIRERDPDVIENHNLFGFDLPFLSSRAAVHRIPLLLGRPGGPMRLERFEEPPYRQGWSKRVRFAAPGRELIDTLDAVRRHDFVVRDMPSHRLKDVARYLGVASPERTYIAGAEIYATYTRDPEMVRRYALDDVAEVDAISLRLHGAPFALAGMAPRRYERLASAGPAMGILEPILVRAYLHAGAAPPYRAASGDSGAAHEGGAVRLYATGVARHVVKADVASLYPSLMRAYAIGPACDQIGALLNVVTALLDLRLMHKDAARAANPDSIERRHHDSLQAAMKLLINSAYGYMGAGSMAMFADKRAADEVTRRGRELLEQVCVALHERGAALIEADTDGVYFAVPDHWDEARERALVAGVAALLPAGIRLEYEGRYESMLSHEVKNYALLTYSGELVVRGAAMRSSRSEPFGEAFLRAALACLLRGDVVGVAQAFERTAGDLRARRFSANDVASRVRLSKSPDEYLATRARHQEQQYEALLAAGQNDWRQGQRVRFYRRADKSSVWLPDEDNVQGAGIGGQGQQTDYDIDHYLNILVHSYAGRLKKAFAPGDFAQLFRADTQAGLFDTPIAQIEPIWILPL